MGGPAYSVYILSSECGSLYIGVTNDLPRRLDEHRAGNQGSYSRRFKTTRLVYFEQTTDVRPAILREKQLKGWSRHKKLELIRSMNPRLEDLSPP